MNKYLFTVLVFFYNDTKDYVRETLQSIADQEGFDLNQLEVVMVDDGSTVDITNLLEEFKQKIPNFFYYKKVHGDNGSVYEYVKENKLMHGKYFTILDSDDIWHKKMLATISTYIDQDPDTITTNIYRWYPTKNKAIKTPVVIVPRTKVFNLNKSKRQIHLLKTPFSWPIGKFHKTQRFYDVQFEHNYVNDVDKHDDAVLFHICPDVVWYYTSLKTASKIIHVTKHLSYARQDRPNSFSNRPWDASKVRTWTKTINFLTSVDVSCNGFYYLIFKKFPESYKNFASQLSLDPITLEKKLKISYIPKILHPIAKLVFKIKIKKLSKKISIKLV